MTVLSEVKVVTADECDCEFKDRPIAHDRLLGIEGLGVHFAGILIADLISDVDPGTGNEGNLLDDPNDFSRFVAQHNWVDPVGMAGLGEAVDSAMDQAWHWRMGEKSLGRHVPR
jgi:hypothetical protein